VQQSPAEDSDRQQNAGCSGKPSLLPLPFECFSESLEIGVTRAAESQVVEPLFCLGEWHLLICDSPEDIRARAPGTVRIRKVLEQTTAQHIQDILLLFRRKYVLAQTSLTFREFNPLT
jgi:hypothetical protein